MAERGIEVSYEAIRLWYSKFGPQFAPRLRRKHQGYGDTIFIDEGFVKIQSKQYYLWRAVAQDGEVVDVFLQKKRNTRFKLGPGHRCVALAEAAIILILTSLLTPLAPACGSDQSPMFAVRGEHTLESRQIDSRFGEKVSPPPHQNKKPSAKALGFLCMTICNPIS